MTNGCQGITAQYAPKADFLRRRAMSLYKSGTSLNEVSRMLQVARSTVQRWVKVEDKKPAINKAIRSAEAASSARWHPAELPTLPYVPGISVTEQSKYVMRSQ